jgi:hypothetical protein
METYERRVRTDNQRTFDTVSSEKIFSLPFYITVPGTYVFAGDLTYPYVIANTDLSRLPADRAT